MNNNMYLTKIVAASLLGDGCVIIPKDGSKNAKYITNKTINHLDYIDWLCERLEQITHVNRHEYQPKLLNSKRAIQIQTRVHPFYTKFRERMYPNGHKVVDPHYLTLLDWEFLAVWYQEDGTMSFRVRNDHGHINDYRDIQISIATNCFSFGDQMLLKHTLKEKLNLEWNIRPYTNKAGNRMYTLNLLRKHADYFVENISKYIVPSFKYKCSYDRLCTADEEIV